eukprot:s757_g16.t1
MTCSVCVSDSGCTAGTFPVPSTEVAGPGGARSSAARQAALSRMSCGWGTMEVDLVEEMPETSDGSESSSSSTLVPNQLASLVPTFDPSKDDLTDYTKKVQLLMNMWPDGKWTELATRLILGCSGSAFQKLQLKSAEITANDKKSIQQIIELLGGQWGQIPLEKKYEAAERALFRCAQRSDETNDSYLARADVLWQELLNKEIKLEELQAYITLRGSNLNAEDKKRVVIDSQVSTEGKLTLPRVSAAIRMLGAGFFHEITAGKKGNKLKTYDATTLVADQGDEDDETSHAMIAESPDDVNEDELIDTLVLEGDTDAILVADFESAATDILQGDEELASALNAYTEARRRLNEKVRSRGFWPISQSSKGKNKGFQRGAKGKFQKGHSSSRRSLQQRILSSTCRICGKVGHWKAECPQRTDAASNPSRSQAPTSYVEVQGGDDGLPLEFLNLPSFEAPMDVPFPHGSVCFASQAQILGAQITPALPEVFDLSDVNPAMSSLSQRLKDLQLKGEPVKHDFSHLSLSQLEETKIDFGSTHLGRTYREMWLDHQDWILWFASRYEKSGKENHQRVLHYIGLMIERAELTGTRIPMQRGMGMSVQQPAGKSKAKAMPKKIPHPPAEQMSIWDAEEEEFELFPDEIETGMSVAPEPVSQDVSHLETRMLHMENALTQIMGMLENIQPAAERQ